MNIKPEVKDRQHKSPKKPKKITETYLHNSGLYYLQRFAASREHFKTVMLRKVRRSCAHHSDQNFDQCAAMVEDLCNKFIELGLLNDELYAQGMVGSLRRQGKSERFIKGKLKQKGVDEEMITTMLSRHNAENNASARQAELRAALKLARRKSCGPFRPAHKVSDNREEEAAYYKKTLAAFARAGFSFEIAKTILDLPPYDNGEKPEIEDVLVGMEL